MFLLSILEGDVTGRFIKFNPDTKEIKVLIDNLGFPNGVAISKDASFVLVAETLKSRFVTKSCKVFFDGINFIYCCISFSCIWSKVGIAIIDTKTLGYIMDTKCMLHGFKNKKTQIEYTNREV